MSEAATRPGGSRELAGKTVARIGFGAMQLHGPGGREAPARATAEAILREAVEAGANHLDTAEFYGGGEVNRLIRAALSPYAEDLVIATKIGAVELPGGGLAPGKSRANCASRWRRTWRRSVPRRSTSSICVGSTGRPDSSPRATRSSTWTTSWPNWRRSATRASCVRSASPTSASPRSRGRCRSASPRCRTSGDCCDDDEPALGLCAANEVAWVPFFPLGSAFVGSSPRFASVRSVLDEPTVVEIAAELDSTPAQVGLAWLLAHSPNVLLIPGTASPEHLRENLAAGSVDLPPEASARLDALA